MSGTDDIDEFSRSKALAFEQLTLMSKAVELNSRLASGSRDAIRDTRKLLKIADQMLTWRTTLRR